MQRRHGTIAAASVKPMPLLRAIATTSISSTENSLPPSLQLHRTMHRRERRLRRSCQSLRKGVGRLLIRHVLETIAQPADAKGKTQEQIIASLPASIREALEQGNQDAFQKAFEALSPEEQQVVAEAMQYLQDQEEEEVDDEDEEPEIADVVQQFEPLLQAIAIAIGDTTHRVEILEAVAELEANLEIENWEFSQVVQRVWAGERDVTTLTAGLDEMDTALVQRVLEIIAGAGK